MIFLCLILDLTNNPIIIFYDFNEQSLCIPNNIGIFQNQKHEITYINSPVNILIKDKFNVDSDKQINNNILINNNLDELKLKTVNGPVQDDISLLFFNFNNGDYLTSKPINVYNERPRTEEAFFMQDIKINAFMHDQFQPGTKSRLAEILLRDQLPWRREARYGWRA